jgi:hypothetical protein
MAGTKTFVNTSPATLQITLFVREGNEPLNQDGTVSFMLDPGETEVVTFATEQNSFLNGILFFTLFEGDLYSKIQFVIEIGSELDALLNKNSTITITKNQTDYEISGSNPSPSQ